MFFFLNKERFCWEKDKQSLIENDQRPKKGFHSKSNRKKTTQEGQNLIFFWSKIIILL